ncbi:MerR family transcriptional regulator [Phnomibacter ginsenosidimutans]|jgi:DNA-binding transcriptional MerR regulator|uniref:MerR family transcriptional regulator n=1 Tax=Phnomibacter ginsenosidimutans TaxID=2676868 RepID=A0A6I6G4N3_9BACT|nr:MerR family transcriptional regulator [Phnomibacter ginsenosidimutans]QGW27037.1 MerR family transcriptional regulator [Phnomibacter ginsenosidimutans]
MDAFTIKDLENLSGIKAHTIRIWEQRYTFLNPQRTDTNIRYYNNQELKTLLNVALLNKYGFKISHIDKMNPEEMKEKILSLSQVQAQQERIINELIQAMIDLDLDSFEEILDNFIMARGIEKTITQIIFPFLEKIGILWITNHINPAQEHLVTNIIRQKLIVGIESTGSHFRSDKALLLFLPEGEHHELGLLFIYYLLKSRGVKVWYLGANVPLKDLEYVVSMKKPDYVYAHLTSVAHNFNFDRFLQAFSIKMPGQKLIVSGQLTQNYKKKLPGAIQMKSSLSEVMEYIAML